MYVELFRDQSELTQHTKQVLEVVCEHISKLCERQLVDQLLGGKFDNSTDDMMAETKSAPLTNIISESAFADLDRLVQHAPQKSKIAKSAVSCFQRNKTSMYPKKTH